MSALGLHLGEIQRVTRQLEDELEHVEHYTRKQREAAAQAVSDLFEKLDLVRLTLLDPADDGQEGDA